MAKMKWRKARKISSIEEKYGRGTVLKNGRIILNHVDSLTKRAILAELGWKMKTPLKPKKYVIVPGLGIRCHRCNRHTQIREHSVITEKHLAQPFYYSRWYYCNNAQCRTNQIMPDEFKVMKELQETWGE
jgi:hypothetical protein